MRLILTTLLFSLATALYSQSNQNQFITCPLSTGFEQDSVINLWGLTTSISSEWKEIALLNPVDNAKEGWSYTSWLSIDSKMKPSETIFTNVAAVRQRINLSTGEVQMQTYTCVYTLREKRKKNK